MSRRFGNENIFVETSGSVPVPVGAATLVPAVSDVVLGPRKFVAAGTGAGAATVKLISGEGFLTVRVPSDNSVCVPLPEDLELAKSSGININIAGAAVEVTLYYTKHDESPGITKSASRAASLNPIVTRTPNEANLGDKT